MSLKSIERYEIVGSFLRPEALKTAREAFARGEIDQATLTTVEDEAIEALVKKQQEAGLAFISDGEFRRSYWHLDFFWGFLGVEHIIKDQGYLFHGEETRADSARLTGPVRFNPEHPVFTEYLSLAKLAGRTPVRQSVPSPSQFYAELVRGDNADKVAEFYPDQTKLFTDIGAAYRQTLQHLYDLGCRHLKLDDCTWGMLVDKNFWETMTGSPYDTAEIQQVYLELNNSALVGLPADFAITTHVCRGNYHSTWASSGGYEPVAETLFGHEEVEAYFLEFDDDRSGNFEPLRHLPENKQVVLGLVTSKKGALEKKESIIARIHEAARYVPLERLSLSPQCGFASTEEGNILTEEEQWEKIALIKEIAEEVWGPQD